MALLSTLEFGDNDSQHYHKVYNVTNVKSISKRHYNQMRPDKEPQCETIELTMVAPDKSDLMIYQWYETGEALSGRLVFRMPGISESDNIEKEILFTGAQCYQLGETFDSQSDFRRLLHIAFKASETKICEITFNTI